MKKLILGVVLALLFLGGCGVQRIQYVPIERTRTITETKIDTVVQVEIEQIRDSVVTADTLSVLSNKYATSTAAVSRGLLHHSLRTTEAKLDIRVQYIDRVVYDSIPYPIEVVRTVKDSAQSREIWTLRIILVLVVGLSLYRMFRR